MENKSYEVNDMVAALIAILENKRIIENREIQKLIDKTNIIQT